MANESIQLSQSVSAVKFYYFNPLDAEKVWNPSAGTPAYEAWSDGSYSSYGVSATQQGTSKRWTATRPAGVTVPFKVVARQVVDGTLANDTVLGSGTQLVPDAAPGTSTGLPVANSSGNVAADLQTIKTQTVTCAAPVTVPSDPADASDVADAFDAVSATLSAILTGVNALTARIPLALFNGITSLAKWLGVMVGKTVDADTLAEVNATLAGASYDNTTDSPQAIRDRGDAAWITGDLSGLQTSLDGWGEFQLFDDLDLTRDDAARLMAAQFAGNTTADGKTLRDAPNTKNALTYTVDANGNRTRNTLDVKR